jgi:hypothetical protein
VLGPTARRSSQIERAYGRALRLEDPVLRDLKRRRMAAPALAVGDGVLAFWAALRETWPQRGLACWCEQARECARQAAQRLQPRANARCTSSCALDAAPSARLKAVYSCSQHEVRRVMLVYDELPA